MPLYLNGTEGVYGVNGTNSTPANRGSDTNTGIVYGTDTVQIATGGTTAVTVDSSQNVGIGTASPSTYVGSGGLALYGTYGTGTTSFAISNGSAFSATNIARIDFRLANSFGGLEKSAAIWALNPNAGANNGGALVFGTSANGTATTPTEAARIDSSGNLLVGTTSSQARMAIWDTSTSAATSRIYKNAASTTSVPCVQFDKYDNNSTTSQVFVQFTINQQGAANGQINGNGASQVAFGSWSDARLKENIVELSPQLNNILALKPCEFDYIESEGGGHQIGFVAQEIQQVYPDTVGERSDGMLTVTGWSKTEARLVKAIQELSAKLDAAEARIAALEAK